MKAEYVLDYLSAGAMNSEYAAAIRALIDERNALRKALEDVTPSLVAAISLAEHVGIKGAPSDIMGRMMLKDYKRAAERARAALDRKP